MFNFVQTLTLSAVLASGTILCGQNAMACGSCCGAQATCAVPGCSAASVAPVVPTDKAVQPPIQMDHAGHAQAANRIRYQSGFQAPAAQPQYYAPVQQYRAPTRGYDTRNDFGNQFRADRKIRGL